MRLSDVKNEYVVLLGFESLGICIRLDHTEIASLLGKTHYTGKQNGYDVKVVLI